MVVSLTLAVAMLASAATSTPIREKLQRAMFCWMLISNV